MTKRCLLKCFMSKVGLQGIANISATTCFPSFSLSVAEMLRDAGGVPLFMARVVLGAPEYSLDGSLRGNTGCLPAPMVMGELGKHVFLDQA